MKCQFATTGEVHDRKGTVYRCVHRTADGKACRGLAYNGPSSRNCDIEGDELRVPRELSEVNCVHLKAITTGETPACCGGTAMIDVGRCEIKGIVTLQGRVVGNATTAACLNCRFIQAKE